MSAYRISNNNFKKKKRKKKKISTWKEVENAFTPFQEKTCQAIQHAVIAIVIEKVA